LKPFIPYEKSAMHCIIQDIGFQQYNRWVFETVPSTAQGCL
jgi:hypothetical protein